MKSCRGVLNYLCLDKCCIAEILTHNRHYIVMLKHFSFNYNGEKKIMTLVFNSKLIF